MTLTHDEMKYIIKHMEEKAYTFNKFRQQEPGECRSMVGNLWGAMRKMFLNDHKAAADVCILLIHMNKYININGQYFDDNYKTYANMYRFNMSYMAECTFILEYSLKGKIDILAEIENTKNINTVDKMKEHISIVYAGLIGKDSMGNPFANSNMYYVNKRPGMAESAFKRKYEKVNSLNLPESITKYKMPKAEKPTVQKKAVKLKETKLIKNISSTPLIALEGKHIKTIISEPVKKENDVIVTIQTNISADIQKAIDDAISSDDGILNKISSDIVELKIKIDTLNKENDKYIKSMEELYDMKLINEIVKLENESLKSEIKNLKRNFLRRSNKEEQKKMDKLETHNEELKLKVHELEVKIIHNKAKAKAGDEKLKKKISKEKAKRKKYVPHN